MGKLAITGGEPVRKTPFTPWPIATNEEALAIEDVLTGNGDAGAPVPADRSVSESSGGWVR